MIPGQVPPQGRQPLAQRRVVPLQVGADIQLRAVAGIKHRFAERGPQFSELESSGVQLPDQRPPIDVLLLGQLRQRVEPSDLAVDFLDPGADRRPGGVADDAVEAVVAGLTRVAGRETEEALDHLPLRRRPFRHAS